MKIDDISGKQYVDLQRETTRQGRTEQKDAFEMLLEQEIGAAQKTSDTSETSPEPQGISGISSVFATPFAPSITSLDSEQPGLLTSADELLSRIESALSAAEGKPRKLESIVQSLSADAESLKSKLGSIPDGHPMKTVANELEILAYVESIKWNRGDYL